MKQKPKLTMAGEMKTKKKDDSAGLYKYTSPVKEYPLKYKETRIKIFQDVTAHDHYKKYGLNVFFNQYNEFIKLVFKNQKVTNPP